MHKTLRKLVAPVARWLGYVPVEALWAASDLTAAVRREATSLETELRHKNTNLRHQIVLRDRLEQEVNFLRQLELAHANQESGIQRATDRIDAITGRLLAYMQSVWPEAVVTVPDLHVKETQPS